MLRKAIAVVAVAGALAGVAALAQAAHSRRTSWRIITLPIKGKSFSYAEPGIAAGPKGTLIVDAATANTGGRPTFWISRDAGAQWTVGRDFDATESATGDADALIGPDGYFYALNLGYNPNPHQPANPRLLVFRSRDGRSWSGPASLPTHGLSQPDRPWLVVNPRNPANVDVASSEGGRSIFMWRSFDHGATFTAPISVSGVATSQSGVALSSRPLFDPTQVGRLFMLYESAAKIPVPHGQVYEIPLTQIWLATSTDAGHTWSRRRVLDSSLLGGALKSATIGHALVASAIDHRGSLYAAFSARPQGATQTTIYVIHSTTHGRRWSAPAPVDAPTRSNVMPALAVAPDGTAYLSWYGSSNSDFRSSHASWSEMFASTPDLLAPRPHLDITQVSGPQPIHIGGVNTAGALGSDTGANWGLRDFQSIAVGVGGAPRLAWADDNGVMATETATPVPAPH